MSEIRDYKLNYDAICDLFYASNPSLIPMVKFDEVKYERLSRLIVARYSRPPSPKARAKNKTSFRFGASLPRNSQETDHFYEVASNIIVDSPRKINKYSTIEEEKQESSELGDDDGFVYIDYNPEEL